MSKKLQRIMLIDDNKFDNFYHERVILKSDFAENVLSMESAKEALEFLTSKGKDEAPELIFLDINMPGMNGWEFLEEYNKLDDEVKSKLIIIMLSTSDNPDDIDKSKQFGPKPLKDFKTKPLTKEMIDDIRAKYF